MKKVQSGGSAGNTSFLGSHVNSSHHHHHGKPKSSSSQSHHQQAVPTSSKHHRSSVKIASPPSSLLGSNSHRHNMLAGNASMKSRYLTSSSSEIHSKHVSASTSSSSSLSPTKASKSHSTGSLVNNNNSKSSKIGFNSSSMTNSISMTKSSSITKSSSTTKSSSMTKLPLPRNNTKSEHVEKSATSHSISKSTGSIVMLPIVSKKANANSPKSSSKTGDRFVSTSSKSSKSGASKVELTSPKAWKLDTNLVRASKVERVSPKPSKLDTNLVRASKVERVSPKPSKLGTNLVRASKVERVSPKPSKLDANLVRTSKVERVSPKPSKLDANLVRTSKVERVSPKPSKLDTNLVRTSKVERVSPKPSKLDTNLVRASKVERVSPKPSKLDTNLVRASKVERVSPKPSKLDPNLVRASKVERISPKPSKLDPNLVRASKVERISPKPSKLDANLLGTSKVDISSPKPSKLDAYLVGTSKVDIRSPKHSKLDANLVGTSKVDISSPKHSKLDISLKEKSSKENRKRRNHDNSDYVKDKSAKHTDVKRSDVYDAKPSFKIARHHSTDEISSDRLMNGEKPKSSVSEKNIKHEVPLPVLNPLPKPEGKLELPESVSASAISNSLPKQEKRSEQTEVLERHHNIVKLLRRKFKKQRKKSERKRRERLLKIGRNKIDFCIKKMICQKVKQCTLKPFRLHMLNERRQNRPFTTANFDSQRKALEVMLEGVTSKNSKQNIQSGFGNDSAFQDPLGSDHLANRIRHRIGLLSRKCRSVNAPYNPAHPPWLKNVVKFEGTFNNFSWVGLLRRKEVRNKEEAEGAEISKSANLFKYAPLLEEANTVLRGTRRPVLDKIRTTYLRDVETKLKESPSDYKENTSNKKSESLTRKKQTEAKSTTSASMKTPDNIKTNRASTSKSETTTIKNSADIVRSSENESILSQIMPPPKFPAPRAAKLFQPLELQPNVRKTSRRESRRHDVVEESYPSTSFKAIIRNSDYQYSCPAEGCSIQFSSRQEMTRHYGKRHKSMSECKKTSSCDSAIKGAFSRKIRTDHSISPVQDNSRTQVSHPGASSHGSSMSRLKDKGRNKPKASSEITKLTKSQDERRSRIMHRPSHDKLTETELRCLVAVEALKSSLEIEYRNTPGKLPKMKLFPSKFGQRKSFLNERSEVSGSDSEHRKEYWETQAKLHESTQFHENLSKQLENSIFNYSNQEEASDLKKYSVSKVKLADEVRQEDAFRLAEISNPLLHEFSTDFADRFQSRTLPRSHRNVIESCGDNPPKEELYNHVLNFSSWEHSEDPISHKSDTNPNHVGSLFNYVHAKPNQYSLQEDRLDCVSSTPHVAGVSNILKNESELETPTVALLARLGDEYPELIEQPMLPVSGRTAISLNKRLSSIDWDSVNTKKTCDKCKNIDINSFGRKRRAAVNLNRRKKCTSEVAKRFNPQVFKVEHLVTPTKRRLEFPISGDPIMKHINQLTGHKRDLDKCMKSFVEDQIVLPIPRIPELKESVTNRNDKLVTEGEVLSEYSTKDVLTKKCLTLAGVSGFEGVQRPALEVIVDIAGEFYEKITNHLKHIIEDEQMNLTHGFPDAAERLFVETGFDGIRGLRKYYHTRVLDHHRWIQKQCLMKRMALGKLLNERRNSTKRPKEDRVWKSAGSPLQRVSSPPVVSLISPPSSPSPKVVPSAVSSPGNRSLLEILSSMDSASSSSLSDLPVSKGKDNVDLDKSNLLRLNFFEEVGANDTAVVLASGSSPSVTQP